MTLDSVTKRSALSAMGVGLSAALTSAASGQLATNEGVPDFQTPTFAIPDVPPEFRGAWQAQVQGSTFNLRTSYNIEIKVNSGADNLPEALIAYFAGDPRRPTSLCRSQLDLVSNTHGRLVFNETLNYQSERNANCPIWDQVVFQRKDGQLLLQWQDKGRRKSKMKMQATALRLSGGQECRTVGGTGGKVWCRDSEGNWTPKRS